MSSVDKNLSEFGKIPSLPNARMGIVISEWNFDVTNSLLQGVLKTLSEADVSTKNIVEQWVPGTFELALGAQKLAASENIHAVICLGCVVQGETKHFDFICDAAANGIMNVGLKYDKPVIFGVLTTDNMDQAMDRAGGKHGNKGSEAAYTALRMLEMYNQAI